MLIFTLKLIPAENRAQFPKDTKHLNMKLPFFGKMYNVMAINKMPSGIKSLFTLFWAITKYPTRGLVKFFAAAAEPLRDFLPSYFSIFFSFSPLFLQNCGRRSRDLFIFPFFPQILSCSFFPSSLKLLMLSFPFVRLGIATSKVIRPKIPRYHISPRGEKIWFSRFGLN